MVTQLNLMFLAQDTDWIQGLVILVIIAFSVLGSIGKWLVQKAEEKRKRREELRQPGMPPRRPAGLAGEVAADQTRRRERRHPARGAPVPPVIKRTWKTSTSGGPVMERVLEVLIEQATGEKPRRAPAPGPPPAPTAPSREREPVRRARPQVRTETLAQREALREKKRQREIELEQQRITQREEERSRQTDARLGHVETQFAAGETTEVALSEGAEISLELQDPDAVRRAIILSEIFAPPLALRG